MFTPAPRILKRYADVLIKFALNNGKGIKRDDVVYIVTQVPGIPLAKEVYSSVLERGGHALINIIDDDFKLISIEKSSKKQLQFFPEKYYRGLVDTVDHWVRILADKDPMYLKNSDPKKVILSSKANRKFREWLDKKEDEGKFCWTLCLYGTEGNAKEAGLSTQQYWNQITKACFLNERDPLKKWRSIHSGIESTIKKLNSLPIDRLHVQSVDTDLWLKVGEKRKWLGGSGHNIPSFEIFTSPDWRGTEGKIYFDLPLYRYGNIIKDIRLEFKNGKVIKATAAKNEKLLKEMIKQKNADKIGEFSLTDSRFSRISKFMADTLYDENFGGRYGNTHLAVGKSYHDAYDGDAAKLSEEEFEAIGFNHSPEHTDIISTVDRTVTAVMHDGSEKVIYRKGKFTL
ncbi:aminopeptidase [Chitinispirillales bacterium ANBcel5]|uniref:aminopeptidase n=1 Tax=Cellulosispirillum alkaliphilum TaxID=3039283 RepID=UPI002A5701F5|nr:aminopeptidase [Chitinispirillales bacterium ANBcel5]